MDTVSVADVDTDSVTEFVRLKEIEVVGEMESVKERDMVADKGCVTVNGRDTVGIAFGVRLRVRERL